jgi:hypothetical protein
MPVLLSICWAAWIAGCVAGALIVFIALRKERTLWREMKTAELIYIRHYTEAQNSLYAGGDAPRILGPGRVEILFYPAEDGEAAD